MSLDFSLSPAFCLHNGILFLRNDEGTLVFGMLDFEDEELKKRILRSIKTFYGPCEPEVLFEKIDNSVFTKKVSDCFLQQKKSEDLPREDKEQKLRLENAAAALLDSLLTNACDENATDIHIEDCFIYFRKKGVLKEISALTRERSDALVRRIKVLANLNVVETRIPQDGQFCFTNALGQPVYIRVSCVPSVQKSKQGSSESVVLRILDVSRVPLKLDALGFTGEQQKVLEQFCQMPFGLVLICGPTGSGKSTTAGAMLEYIQTATGGKRKIVSIEDPPEYVLPGVTQIAVHTEQGVTFASALRSVFRQDPDVIFIGEIRDSLTAQTAVQASLTGHLVFATLHTASASQAIMRLTELSVSPAVAKSVVCGVIVQRLDASGLTAEVKKMQDK